MVTALLVLAIVFTLASLVSALVLIMREFPSRPKRKASWRDVQRETKRPPLGPYREPTHLRRVK